MNLTDELTEARAKVAVLEQLAASATCRNIGHNWRRLGGCNCGCEDGSCSVPVNECGRCGDCDYGDNDEAGAVRVECAKAKEEG